MISQKTRYALRALLYLVERGKGAPVQIGSIAETQQVPRKYLELIMLELKKAGIVTSVRGPAGGYRLARPPEDISFGEVIRTLEGPIALVPCASVNFYARCGDCHDEETCAMNVHRQTSLIRGPYRATRGRSTSRSAGRGPRVPLVVTDRALRALATLRSAQHARSGQALGLVAAPGGQIGLVLDVPGTDDLIFARDLTTIFFVAAELGTRLDGRVLDRGGVPGRERFTLGPARLHILATDDDGALRDLLTIVLEEAGYRVTFSSAQTVAEVTTLAPDLLLLDGRGQGADSGWAFLERLKTDPATVSIPVLVLTGLGQEADEHAARTAELDTILIHKPFNLDDLLAQIRLRLAGDPAGDRGEPP